MTGEPGLFCPDCGARMASRADRRRVCPGCGYVRYRNPIVGVAVVVRDGSGRVLLGRRASGAYAGLWCIPCGFVEYDEHIRDAAAREMGEETGLAVTIGDVIAVHSNFHQPEKQTVGIWFAAAAATGSPFPADGEFSELGYWDPADAPPLAFPTDALVLAQLAGQRRGPPPGLDPLLELAFTAAEAAGEFVRGRLWEDREQIGTKSSEVDMVTEVDRASETLIVEAITAGRPGDGIVAEEGSSRPTSTGVRWVIDPLDGTTNYLYRLPAFSVVIAVEVEGRVHAGVVHDVMAGETFWALRGYGAFRGTAPIRVSAKDRLATALVATGFSYSQERRRLQAERLVRVLPAVRDIRRMGSAALDLCAVACGRVDGYFEEGLNPWDYAAGWLLVEEAGGRFERDEDGLIVAAGEGIFRDLRSIVAG